MSYPSAKFIPHLTLLEPGQKLNNVDILQDVGLHREYPYSVLENENDVDLRRRVFWSAYCMDRSICSALQRPVSIPDAAINTKFPYVIISAPSSPFMGVVYYHQLVSEMLQVHFQGQSLPNDISWEDWLSEMEQKLRKWYESTRHEAGNDEMGDFALARGLTILHRPSPRMPLPSDRSLLVAFEAASSSARSHRDHIRAGFFRRPWCKYCPWGFHYIYSRPTCSVRTSHFRSCSGCPFLLASWSSPYQRALQFCSDIRNGEIVYRQLSLHRCRRLA